jgi:hypothetical protein
MILKKSTKGGNVWVPVIEPRLLLDENWNKVYTMGNSIELNYGILS